MKFMQYTKFMNDDDVDDTNLFDLEAMYFLRILILYLTIVF